MWADNQGSDFSSTAVNQFMIRASGGLQLFGGSLFADAGGANTNGLLNPAPGLVFGGPGSGEGIASKRLNDGNGNTYGLDFFTMYTPRFSIANNGDMWIHGHSLFLREPTDSNHGLRWSGISNTFAGLTVDGPVLFGYNGGGLGVEQFGAETMALSWNSAGHVGIGTASPSLPLQVVNPDAATSSGALLATSGGGVASDIPSSPNAGAGQFVGATGVVAVSKTTSGDGVVGLALSSNKAIGGGGFGVYGESHSPNGAGLYGLGTTTNTPGVIAGNQNNTGPALTIAYGSLRVAGAGLGTSTPAFIHRANAATFTFGGSVWASVITHPLCDNDANAILIVTPNSDPGGGITQAEPHAVGVAYNGSHWMIVHGDGSAIATNTAYNVLVIKP